MCQRKWYALHEFTHICAIDSVKRIFPTDERVYNWMLQSEIDIYELLSRMMHITKFDWKRASFRPGWPQRLRCNFGANLPNEKITRKVIEIQIRSSVSDHKNSAFCQHLRDTLLIKLSNEMQLVKGRRSAMMRNTMRINWHKLRWPEADEGLQNLALASLSTARRYGGLNFTTKKTENCIA